MREWKMSARSVYSRVVWLILRISASRDAHWNWSKHKYRIKSSLTLDLTPFPINFVAKTEVFIELGTIYIQGYIHIYTMVCLLDLKVQSCAPFIPILVLSHQTCSSLRRCSLTFSFITGCMCDMGNHKAKQTRNKLRNEQKRTEKKRKQLRMSSIFSLLWTKRKILTEI
jgi:hypothetical protein